MSFRRRRGRGFISAAAAAAAASAAIAAGCGGSDSGGQPASEQLGEEFAKRSEQIYADMDRDRDEDFLQGVPTDDCFVISDEGAGEVGKALSRSDGDYTADEGAFLVGPPGEDETITCGITPVGSDRTSGIGSLSAGTTLVDAEGTLQRLLRRDGA